MPEPRSGLDLALAHRRDQLAELHLQLIDQLGAAFGRCAELGSLHLRDGELEVRDLRVEVERAGFRFLGRALLRTARSAVSAATSSECRGIEGHAAMVLASRGIG